jgi:uncharacterized protein
LYRVVNATRQKILAEPAKKSTDFLGRALGLMFTKSLAAGTGLILEPCNSIHMFWMNYAIDAIFLDKNARVVGLVPEIKPWRASKMFLHATTCVELPAGTIAKTDTRIGDTLISQEIPPNDQSKGASLLDLTSNKRFSVEGDVCTVGSDVTNGIQYELDKSLSPTQFVLKADNGKYTIEDSSSRHGTYLNGERIGRAQEIKQGDVVKAGTTLFLFEVTA